MRDHATSWRSSEIGGTGKISRNFGGDGFVSLLMSAPGSTSYSVILTEAQVAELRRLLEENGFTFSPKPYTILFARKPAQRRGLRERSEASSQGKGIEDFVSFELEPKVLREARLGYDEVHRPEVFEPHFGIDESGKAAILLGPLVIAGACTDRELARKFLENRDPGTAERIGSDARIRALAKMIRAGERAER